MRGLTAMHRHGPFCLLARQRPSPGDVKPERAAADELVNDMNKQMRDLGWQVILYKWEDVPPGFGRPQEIIKTQGSTTVQFFSASSGKGGDNKPASTPRDSKRNSSAQ